MLCSDPSRANTLAERCRQILKNAGLKDYEIGKTKVSVVVDDRMEIDQFIKDLKSFIAETLLRIIDVFHNVLTIYTCFIVTCTYMMQLHFEVFSGFTPDSSISKYEAFLIIHWHICTSIELVLQKC